MYTFSVLLAAQVFLCTFDFKKQAKGKSCKVNCDSWHLPDFFSKAQTEALASSTIKKTYSWFIADSFYS